MRCPVCGAVYPAGPRFCAHDGAALCAEGPDAGPGTVPDGPSDVAPAGDAPDVLATLEAYLGTPPAPPAVAPASPASAAPAMPEA